MKYFLFFLLSCQFIFAQQKQLTPEIVWQLKRVSSPAISPDGKLTVYNLRDFNVAENNGQSDIYLLNNETDKSTLLIGGEGNQTDAFWKPNDKNILVYNNNGKLTELNITTNESKVVNPNIDELENIKISPNGKKVAYTREVKVDITAQDIYPDMPKANAKIYDGLMMRHWTTWEDGMRSHLFVADYPSFANATDVMPSQPFDTPLKPHGGSEQICWSPDSRTIAYTCKKKHGTAYAMSTNSDIYLYEIESFKTYNLTEGMQGYDVNPTYSSDAKYIAWLSMEKDGYEADKNRLFVYDFEKNKRINITEKLDMSCEDIHWSNDNKSIYFQTAYNGTHQLFSIDLATQKMNQLTEGMYDYGAFDVSGNNIIAVRNSMMQPHELYSVNTKTKEQKQVTFANDELWKSVALGRVEKRFIRTSDGKQMLTWVAFPPNFDKTKKYPTLLFCQGGPQSVVSQFFSYRWNVATMTAQGYIVVMPNRRGLPSFGQKWNDDIRGQYGAQAMTDLLTAIDEVSKEPYVDKERRAAVGASFGGYSVYWLMGNHKKRFKSFIAHCGIYNMESMYGETEEMFFTHHDNEGAPWDSPKPSNYQFSPHLFTQNWDTPILVIHNEKDFRVPLSQGLGAFTAAQVKGIKSRFLYFSDEGHWVTKPQNSIVWSREFYRWLRETLN